MDDLKSRINAAITTMRKWPNVVNVNDENYGVYFIGKDIFIIYAGHDFDLDELEEFKPGVVEKIAVELEANRFESCKSFVG